MICLCMRSLICFNPRICKRCDSFATVPFLAPTGFNPRICKRCDGRILLPFQYACRFNPRICKRCDCARLHHVYTNWVSIHASVKDATKGDFALFGYGVFQSTHL